MIDQSFIDQVSTEFQSGLSVAELAQKYELTIEDIEDLIRLKFLSIEIG